MPEIRPETSKIQKERALAVHHLCANPKENLSNLCQSEESTFERIGGIGHDANATRRATRIVVRNDVGNQRWLHARISVQEDEDLPRCQLRSAILRSTDGRLRLM